MPLENNNRRKATSPLQTERSVRSKGEVCQICKTTTIGGPDKTPAVVCSGCSSAFHASCGGVSDNLYYCYIVAKNKPWYCYLCNLELRNKTKGNYDSITRIEDVVTNVNDQIMTMAQEIKKIRATESSWSQEIETRILDDVDAKIEAKISERLTEQIELSISKQLAELNPERQASLVAPVSNNNTSNTYRKNIIITCVPERIGENVVTIVKKIAKQVNFLQDSFIDNCFRIEKKLSRGEQDKPSSILLKCTTEIARDNFLRCYFNYIKKHPLAPKDVGLEGDERIYMNEHMNPTLQPLLKRALAMRRDNRLSQVASHSAYLSVKLTVNSRPMWKRIYSEDDLNNLPS